MRILVTGAAGRIGRTACLRLLESGHDVTGVDRVFTEDLPRDRFAVVDLHNLPSVYELLRDVEIVVHLANAPNPVDPDFQRVFHNNNGVNTNVMIAAAQVGVRRLVYSSSIQAMTGDRSSEEEPSSHAYLPLDGDSPPNYGNLYGLSKYIGEQILELQCRQRPMEGVSLRFPAVVDDRWLGQRRQRHPASSNFYRMEEVGAYLAMSDAASLIVACVEAPSLPGYRVYAPAADDIGWSITIEEAVERFFPNVPLRRPVSELRSLIDVSRITAEVGWSPKLTAADAADAATA